MTAIGLFDSGVGGFTILKAVVETLPHHSIIYLADQANLPYASKSSAFLIRRSCQITDHLLFLGCTTIVIACNTATVSAVASLRKLYPKINFVGVEPAIKPAAKFAQSGKILVLATSHTLQSQRLIQLCDQFAKKCQVTLKDMPGWIPLAESGRIKSPQTKQVIIDSLLPLKKLDPQAIVLACTHYPIFITYLHQVFPRAKIFDPGDAVVAQVKRIHTGSKESQPTIKIFSTKSASALKVPAANLLPFPVRIYSLVL